MQHIDSKTKDWKRVDAKKYETPEGIILENKQLADVCSFYGVPQTLLNVDKKFDTGTFHEVTKVHAPVVKLMVDDEHIQVLDPKSVFADDDKFSEMVNIANEITGIAPAMEKNRAVFELPALESDSFVGDLFKRSFAIDRLPQGGINLSTKLLRLVCTNGQTVSDSQYRSLIRSAKVDKTVLGAFWDAVSNFDVDGYFKSLFTKNGEIVLASVADYLGMRDTLEVITEGADIVDLLFPQEPIVDFYKNQDIDITKMSRNTLNRLPSGIGYYNCFNILTNGAKHAEKTLENEMKVADWCRPSRLTQIKDSDLSFVGMPHFDMKQIKTRMGDA